MGQSGRIYIAHNCHTGTLTYYSDGNRRESQHFIHTPECDTSWSYAFPGPGRLNNARIGQLQYNVIIKLGRTENIEHLIFHFL